MFQGCIYHTDGNYQSPVVLKDATAAYQYCELNKHLHQEIRILLNDAIVVQIRRGIYVHPHKWEEYRRSCRKCSSLKGFFSSGIWQCQDCINEENNSEFIDGVSAHF